MTPTQRSLKKLRAEGYLVAVVERWNQYARVRQDLFGFIDLIAIKGDETLAVQTTSGDNVAARLNKIQQTQAAAVWIESPHRRIVVHGWRKVGSKGKRKLWDCREVYMSHWTQEELEAITERSWGSNEQRSPPNDGFTQKHGRPVVQ